MLSFVSTSFGDLSSKERRRNLLNVEDHVTWVILKSKINGMSLHVIQKEALYCYHHCHHPEGQYLKTGRHNLTSNYKEYLPHPRGCRGYQSQKNRDIIRISKHHFLNPFSGPLQSKIGSFHPRTMLAGYILASLLPPFIIWR